MRLLALLLFATAAATQPVTGRLDAGRLDGMRLRLSDYGGRVVVLNWWADFCGPCFLEMPGLSDLVEKYRGDPRVAFVAVAQNTPGEIQTALAERRFDYEQTAGGPDAKALLDGGFPRHVVLGPDGRVAFDFTGGMLAIDRLLDAVLMPLVASLPPAE